MDLFYYILNQISTCICSYGPAAKPHIWAGRGFGV